MERPIYLQQYMGELHLNYKYCLLLNSNDQGKYKLKDTQGDPFNKNQPSIAAKRNHPGHSNFIVKLKTVSTLYKI